MGERNIFSYLLTAVIQVALCITLGIAEGRAQTCIAPQAVVRDQFLEAVQRIRRDYVDPVDDEKLATGCREGMLGTVDRAILPQVTQASLARHTSVTNQFVDLFCSISQYSPEARNEAQLVGACLRGALKTLDSKSAFLDAEAFRELQVGSSAPVGGIGLELELEASFPTVVATYEGGPAERAGFKTGDVIARIGATSTDGLLLADVVKALRGPVGSSVTLVIARKGSTQPVDVTLTREDIRIQSVRSRSLVPGFAYIRIVQFQEATGPLVAQAVENAYRENQGDLKGLILDLRNNPGGLLNGCVAVAAVFLPRGALVLYTEGRVDDARMRLNASPENYLRGRAQKDYVASLPPAVKSVPMVVLVNRGTVSGSEIVAAALQDHRRARILGERTFAVGTVQTILPLAGNTALKLTTARVFSPNGRSVAPVIPDVALEPSELPAAAFGSADDVQLMQALKVLGGQPPLAR